MSFEVHTQVRRCAGTSRRWATQWWAPLWSDTLTHTTWTWAAPSQPCCPRWLLRGATRRNRPSLAPGDLVYARVTAASRDADPEITCTDAAGKVHCSSSLFVETLEEMTQ